MDEMNKFSETHKLLKLTEEEIENPNISTRRKGLNQ